jgi:hypothetical protein
VSSADDEGRHPAGPGRLWAEAWSFDFAARDGSIGGYVRLGLHPGDGTAWYWAYVAGPGRPTVAVRDHEVVPPRGASLEVRAEGLWSMITCETPQEHWSIGLEAFAVGLDDPADAYRGERGDRMALGLDLEWEAAAPLFAYRQGGYQQACEVHGDVRIDDERIGIDGWGQRDHWWGVQDWWAEPRWWASGRLDDATMFHGVVAGPPGSPSCRTGYVARPGEPVDVVAPVALRTSLGAEGLPESASARLGPLTLTLAPIAQAPLLLPPPPSSPAPGPSRLARALCRFDAGGAGTGYGWASWLQPAPIG